MKSQNDAGYVSHPVAGRQCDDCTMFRPPNHCSLVAGEISPDGHCEYWEPKIVKSVAKSFDQVMKGEPAGPADVHVATALGNQRPRRTRYRTFSSFVSGGPKKPEDGPSTFGPTPIITATTKMSYEDVLRETFGYDADPNEILQVADGMRRLGIFGKVYATTASLPKPVRDKFEGKPKKLRQWMHVWNDEYASHGDEKRAFASAWSAVGKATASPFPYDADFLSRLRKSQVPSFLRALTHPGELPKARVKLADLRAIQDRINSRHVAERMGKSGPRATVVRLNDQLYIADGHDRLSARFLMGKSSARVRLHDIDHPADEAALKKRDWSTAFRIEKADPDKQQLFGWASVVTKNGVAIVDKQDDIIPVDELESAAYDFCLSSRRQGDMHQRTEGVGKLIESMVFSAEKQKALGIDLGLEGWWVGFQCDCKDLWKDVKSGKKLEFSIGGAAIPEKVA